MVTSTGILAATTSNARRQLKLLGAHMIFMLVTLFLGTWHLREAFLGMQGNAKPTLRVAAHHMAFLSLGGATMFGMMLPAMANRLSNDGDLAVYFLLACGILSTLLFGHRLYLSAKGVGPQRGLQFGLLVWGALAGVYVVGAVADHFWFWRGHAAGVGSASGIGAEDVQCDLPLLVRIEQDGAIYRCPSLILYGDVIGQPFVPWPNYREGKSVPLKNAIARLEAKAKVEGEPGRLAGPAKKSDARQ